MTAEEKPDTSANPDPEDNKPDPEEDKYSNIRVKGRDKSNEPRRKPGSLGQRKGTDALRRENKVVRDAANAEGLTRAQRRTLKERVSGQAFSYHQIRKIGREIKGEN